MFRVRNLQFTNNNNYCDLAIPNRVQNGDYSLNKINIILMLGKTEYSYHIGEKLYLNVKDILLNNIQM